MSWRSHHAQLDRLRDLAAPAHRDAVLRQVRGAPAAEQPVRLVQALHRMGDGERQALYPLLTDEELGWLCGDRALDYIATLSDDALRSILTDSTGRAARQALRRYQHWRRYVE
jgi:hypothetical protein